MYLSDGTSFVGYYHEMDDGTKMTGKGHNNFSQNLFTLEELGISNDVENETNPNINRLEEDIERANETAEFLCHNHARSNPGDGPVHKVAGWRKVGKNDTSLKELFSILVGGGEISPPLGT